jgi:hypothetical protein
VAKRKPQRQLKDFLSRSQNGEGSQKYNCHQVEETARRHAVPKNGDAAHGLTVSPPNREKLTMRFKPLKSPGLILSLSKDEAKSEADAGFGRAVR